MSWRRPSARRIATQSVSLYPGRSRTHTHATQGTRVAHQTPRIVIGYLPVQQFYKSLNRYCHWFTAIPPTLWTAGCVHTHTKPHLAEWKACVEQRQLYFSILLFRGSEMQQKWNLIGGNRCPTRATTHALISTSCSVGVCASPPFTAGVCQNHFCHYPCAGANWLESQLVREFSIGETCRV